MIIITDTREQNPLSFTGYDCTVEEGSLPTGDYSIKGLTDRVCLERKSLNDLISCLMGYNRERFERELARARGYDLFAVLVESSWDNLINGRYHSRMNPRSAVQSVIAFQVRYKCNFLFTGNRQNAAYIAFSMFEKYLVEQRRRYDAVLGNLESAFRKMPNSSQTGIGQ